MQIHHVQADHYLIPLPTVLSDSTHGAIRGFELLTVRLYDADGAVGVGYTYTVGTGGAAVHALLARDLPPVLAGREAERIEDVWQAMWWALHYGGRGGAQALAISAVDIALWDLRTRRQDEGRPPLAAAGHRARASDAHAPRPRVPADGGRQHALERRRGDPGRARVGRARPALARGADEPRRRAGPRPHRTRGRPADRRGREPSYPLRVPAPDRRGRRDVPRARRHQLRRRHHVHEGLSPGRGLQPARHVARRARRDRAPAGRGAESLLSRSARLRSRSVHRRAVAPGGGGGGGARAPRTRHRVRLEGARRRPRTLGVASRHGTSTPESPPVPPRQRRRPRRRGAPPRRPRPGASRPDHRGAVRADADARPRQPLLDLEHVGATPRLRSAARRDERRQARTGARDVVEGREQHDVALHAAQGGALPRRNTLHGGQRALHAQARPG